MMFEENEEVENLNFSEWYLVVYIIRRDSLIDKINMYKL